MDGWLEIRNSSISPYKVLQGGGRLVNNRDEATHSLWVRTLGMFREVRTPLISYGDAVKLLACESKSGPRAGLLTEACVLDRAPETGDAIGVIKAGGRKRPGNLY